MGNFSFFLLFPKVFADRMSKHFQAIITTNSVIPDYAMLECTKEAVANINAVMEPISAELNQPFVTLLMGVPLPPREFAEGLNDNEYAELCQEYVWQIVKDNGVSTKLAEMRVVAEQEFLAQRGEDVHCDHPTLQ